MSKLDRALPFSVAVLVVVALFLSACATQPAPASAPGGSEAAKSEQAGSSKPAPAQAAGAVPAKAPPAAVAPEKPAPPAAAPTPAGPRVGGTVVWASQKLASNELDPQTALGGEGIVNYMGAGLIARDPMTGQIVPSLAESWKTSEDGLTYEFKMKKNLKWHDGAPLTAGDYIYTIQRARDPATKSPTAFYWASVESAEAPDDHTLILKLSAPDLTFLQTFAQLSSVIYQPVPKHAIERLGDKFATQAVLSGPFKFKESVPGMKIVLERNPDFNWGVPPNPGAPYIQNLEFRSVREYATILAGLEAGEIDLALVDSKDVDRLKATGKVYMVSMVYTGLNPSVVINTSKAPWDDVRVRKAINFALDRQAMVKVAAFGLAEEQRGPLAKGAYGYWPGVEKIGYGFDLNRAKALMAEAGYTPGSGGTLEKGGKPLRFTAPTYDLEPYPKLAQMVKENLKALGIDLEIRVMPRKDTIPVMQSGGFDLAVTGNASEPNGFVLLSGVFHSSGIAAGSNRNRVSDARLDELIASARSSLSEAKAFEIAAEAQKLIVENAYAVPIYAPRAFYAVSNRVKGVIANQNTFPRPYVNAAYVEGGR